MIDICRPACFPVKPPDAWRRLRIALVFAGALLVVAPAVAGTLLRLDLGRVEHPLFMLEGLAVEIGVEGGRARIQASRLAIGDKHWSDLALDCARFHLDDNRFRCADGSIDVPGLLGRTTLSFEFDHGEQRGRFALRTHAGESVQGVFTSAGNVELKLANVGVERVTAWWPPLAAWGPTGRLRATLVYQPGAGVTKLAIDGRLDAAAFSSVDGLNAAEGVTLDVVAEATLNAARQGKTAGDDWDWRADVDWVAGEAYLHPVFLQAGAQMQATGRATAQRVQLHRATLQTDGVRSAELVAEFGFDPFHIAHATLTLAGADLAIVGPRYIAPILAPASADGISFAGQVDAALTVERDALIGFDVMLDQVVLGLAAHELHVGPVTGRIPWHADAPGRATLAVAGGRWKSLDLAPFDIDARLDGAALSIDSLAIPLLDGRLVFNTLSLTRNQGGWSGQGGLVVEPISMAHLTRALGLPEMTGVLTASLPALVISPGEVRLQGALVISLFEGYLQVTRLQLFEPFGVAAHLFADVEARNINLAQLTDTFAFGSISGFVDADILGLELVHWQPVRFDASVRSSPGRFERRISQRAVQNISALGGVGAAAALQRGFLGLFESFGYREIGLSCKLAGNVCIMDGLEPHAGNSGEDGFVIVRGGGIPALNVIGYNRRVDWPELLDRLRRAIESNVPPVVE